MDRFALPETWEKKSLSDCVVDALITLMAKTAATPSMMPDPVTSVRALRTQRVRKEMIQRLFLNRGKRDFGRAMETGRLSFIVSEVCIWTSIPQVREGQRLD